MFRRFLGLDRVADSPARRAGGEPPVVDVADQAETETVRRIVARLEALPPSEARYLASFAYVMSRAAEADLEVSDDETALIERFIVEYGGVDASQAVLVTEMAKFQARLQGGTEDYVVTREFRTISTPDQRVALLRCCFAIGGTEDYVVTREFRTISTPDQRVALLRCCFAIGAVDGTITAEEAAVVNQIARELDLEPDVVNRVRAEFHDQLSSVRALRRASGSSGPS